MSRASDDLVHEHEAIGFLKEFVDTCHHGKEEGVLFPMAEQALPDAQWAQMAQAFEAHESRVVGARRHEQLHA